VIGRIASIFCAALIGTSDMSQARCRQALALGLDVSGSVDAREYALQINGLANALEDPDLRRTILALPDAPMKIAVFEWSGAGFQRLILPWTSLHSAGAISDVSTTLRMTQRISSPPETALGSAMFFGAQLLRQRSDCWHHVLDLSGDGKRNTGPRPVTVKSRLSSDDLTINALVIGSDASHGNADGRQVQIGELSSYFRARVILGAGAFVETALGFEAYEDAILRKLLRETDVLQLSGHDTQGRLFAVP